jgi:general secretion pathway protein G
VFGFRLFSRRHLVLQRLRAVRQSVRQNQDGFTLVELLIVIVILGILAGIVVFAVNGITDRGIDSSCKTDIQTVQAASEAYYAQKGGWAAAIGVADDTNPNDLIGAGFLAKPPTSTKYTITYYAVDTVVGTVTHPAGTVSGALASGGDC